MVDRWYKLDNAAKIFPAISSNDGTNYFRLEAIFFEDIKPEFLEEALKSALLRFPTFKVKIRPGFFWYYFETNNGRPLIRKESNKLFDTIDTDLHDKFMFHLEYYNKRLSLEIFHALSDGTGGSEFFKSIIYYYLALSDHPILNDGSILTNDVENASDETQDSFNYHYNSRIKGKTKEPTAYHIKGTNYLDNQKGLIHFEMDLEDINRARRKYNATLTQYLGSVIIYSIMKNYDSYKKMPIRLFIPVNARKVFDSHTLRNFVLYIRTGLDMSKKQQYSFEEIIEKVKLDFKSELDQDKLKQRLASNVKIEKNFFVRILLLPIKSLIMRLSYKAFGSKLNTVSFSNLGVVNVPEDFKKYVARMHFIIGSSKDCPINISLLTFNNKLQLSFSTSIQERTIERDIARFLSSQEIKVICESNKIEVI